MSPHRFGGQFFCRLLIESGHLNLHKRREGGVGGGGIGGSVGAQARHAKAFDVAGKKFDIRIGGRKGASKNRKASVGQFGKGGVAAEEIAVEVHGGLGQRTGNHGRVSIGEEIPDLADITFVGTGLGTRGLGGKEEDGAGGVGVLFRIGEQVKGGGIDKDVIGIGSGEGVAQVAGDDAEGGAGFAVGFHPVLSSTPELGGTVHHAQEQDDEEGKDGHGHEQLEHGEGGGVFNRGFGGWGRVGLLHHIWFIRVTKVYLERLVEVAWAGASMVV